MRRLGSRGATLIELLVGVALFAGFATGAHVFLLSFLRAGEVLEAAARASEAARIGIHLIERDLRGAGYGPSTPVRPALQRAARDEVRIASDLNGDGDAADANEAIGYGFDAPRRLLTRSQGDAPPQPLIEDLSSDGLLLSYFDAAGNRIVDADQEAARAAIRRVDVAVTVEVRHPDPAIGAVIRSRQSASIAIRNG